MKIFLLVVNSIYSVDHKLNLRKNVGDTFGLSSNRKNAKENEWTFLKLKAVTQMKSYYHHTVYLNFTISAICFLFTKVKTKVTRIKI